MSYNNSTYIGINLFIFCVMSWYDIIVNVRSKVNMTTEKGNLSKTSCFRQTFITLKVKKKMYIKGLTLWL